MGTKILLGESYVCLFFMIGSVVVTSIVMITAISNGTLVCILSSSTSSPPTGAAGLPAGATGVPDNCVRLGVVDYVITAHT